MTVVNERTLRDLEFDRVVARIRERAASELGAWAVEALFPAADPAAIGRELERVGEMMAAVGKGLVVGPLEDLGPLLERARETTSLSGEDFLRILRTLESGRRLKGAIGELEGRCPELTRIADRIGIFRELEGAIRRSFDEDGELLESASPRLGQLVRRKRAVEAQVEAHLKAFLEAPEHAGLIQEALVTRRSSRLVIPIKSHAKHDLDCVVHDRSDSGQTLYVEPHAVVEDNNRIRELEGEIRDERIRILKELTGKVRQESRSIRETLEALRVLDGLYARARFAVETDCSLPRLNEEGRVRLRGARHPLLDPKTVVPVDIAFGDRHLGVLITGPNTGGKTVTLKTVGLLTLMAQSGIPVPADPESELSIFQEVRSDIGDEQSIQQSLSTFSSHMSNIVGILGEIGEKSLVLIDELGAGTDPQEGAALGMAILNRIIEVGSRLAVTTHFSALKHFAYKHDRLKTCSVEFDVGTLQPTYRLVEGVGSSNAFTIAERLGLDREIVRDAKRSLSEGAVKAEEIIKLLERERVALSEERAHLARERRSARAEEERHRARLEKLEADAEAQLRGELKELKTQLKETRVQLERALHLARLGGEAELKGELKRLEGAEKRLEAVAERVFQPAEQPLPPGALRAGMRVRVAPLGKAGVVRKVSGEDRVEVEVEEMRVEVESAELTPLPSQEVVQERGKWGWAEAGSHELSASGPGLELNVRGLTVSEALRAVDLYLDRLVTSDVRRAAIVHGKGTGALRQEIRKRLAQDRRVVRHYAAPAREGGDGVTIVEL